MRSTITRLQFLFAVLLTVVLVGTVGFAVTEELSTMDSLYLTVVTIATVGYGDISPATTAGRIIAVVIILGGAGVFISFLGNLAEYFLTRRERQERIEKLHMVMGIFFSELGTDMLRLLARHDAAVGGVKEDLRDVQDWDEGHFRRVSDLLTGYEGRLELSRDDLGRLCEIMEPKRELLLRVLENPALREKETSTELMRACFHLLEELSLRGGNFDGLPNSDVEHMTGDIRRVYHILIPQWVEYLGYLNRNYSYLFSLTLRTNPFDPEASPVIHE